MAENKDAEQPTFEQSYSKLANDYTKASIRANNLYRTSRFDPQTEEAYERAAELEADLRLKAVQAILTAQPNDREKLLDQILSIRELSKRYGSDSVSFDPASTGKSILIDALNIVAPEPVNQEPNSSE